MNTQNPTTKRPLTMDFNEILTKLKAHPGDPSITITSNAAHTYMDAALTREHLKKLGREAEQLVLQHYDKHTAAPVIERSRQLLADLKMVDHLPGMAIFVNREIAELVHLPFTLEERVTVGSSFFTRICVDRSDGHCQFSTCDCCSTNSQQVVMLRLLGCR